MILRVIFFWATRAAPGVRLGVEEYSAQPFQAPLTGSDREELYRWDDYCFGPQVGQIFVSVGIIIIILILNMIRYSTY